jgi:hypothetical protein
MSRIIRNACLSVTAAVALVAVAPFSDLRAQVGPIFRKATPFSYVDVNSHLPIKAAELTIKPPKSGTAVLKSRGWCAMNQHPSIGNYIEISAGTSLASAFDPPGAEFGLISLSPGTANYVLGFTSERSIAVSKGKATTFYLGARSMTSPAPFAQCSGTFSVEVFTGNAP